MSCNLHYNLIQEVETNNKGDTLSNNGTYPVDTKNVVHAIDCKDHNDMWICLNIDCLYHSKNKEALVSLSTIDDEPTVDDDNIEWICINKDCVYHNHIKDYVDQEENSISNKV